MSPSASRGDFFAIERSLELGAFLHIENPWRRDGGAGVSVYYWICVGGSAFCEDALADVVDGKGADPTIPTSPRLDGHQRHGSTTNGDFFRL